MKGYLRLFLILFLVAGPVDGYCPRYWLRRGRSNYCYRFIEFLLRKNWTNARLNCLNAQGDLVSTISMEESNWLENEIRNRNITEDVRQWWTGAKKNQNTQVWEWADGSPINPALITWAPGEPVNQTNKNCGMITLNGMVAAPCGEGRAYICRRTVDTPSPCPHGWQLSGEKCYVYKDRALPWGQARQECINSNGDLAVSSTMTINRLVKDYSAYYQDDVWVGLKSFRLSGGPISWSWSDGTESTTSNTRWIDDEPNVPNNQANNTCGLAMKSGSTTKLFAAKPCGQNKPFACEKPVGTCDDGWRNHEGNCYKIITQNTGFDAATRYCAERGANLLTIKSSTEQEFVNSVSDELHDQGQFFLWVGLSAQPGQPFTWSDGEALRGNDYNNWADGEPDRVPDKRDCAVIYTGNRLGHWSSSHKCGAWRRFMCKIPAGVPVIEPTTTPIPYYCEEGWKLRNGQCYQFNDTEKSWPLARLDCRAKGGDLAVIRDADTNNFITANLERDHWIGLHKRNNIGNFTWLDETTIPTYWNWAPGEPNDSNQEESCVEIWAGANYKGMWNDLLCNRAQAYLCQRQAYVSGVTPPPVTTLGGWTEKCGPSWEDHLGTPYCYQFHMEFVDWQDARDTCRNYGGDLLTLGTPEEQAYIHARTLSSSDIAYWIGINVRGDGGTWGWSDGSPLPYFNWAEGWPDVSDNKKCGIYMIAANNWEMRQCNGRYGYICRKRGNVIQATTPAPVTRTPQPGYIFRCQMAWYEYNGNCYQFVKDPAKNWYEARATCVRRNGDLASVVDERENNFLFGTMVEHYNDTGNIWIGLQDYRGRDYYEWSDHSPVTYTNWARNEPNNHQGKDERCTEILLWNGKWNDNKCEDNVGYNKGYICKKPTAELPIRTSTASPTPPGGCPEGTQFLFQGACYMFNSSSVTFDEAQASCQAWAPDGNLVSLLDRYQHAYIVNRLVKNSGTHWIGFSNRGSDEGEWSWTSGFVSPDDFTHWDDTFTGNERDSCAAMRTGQQRLGLWQAQGCNRKNDFICQSTRPGYTTTLRPTVPGPCEEGWHQFKNFCFKAGFTDGEASQRMVWSDAIANCNLQNADLVSIHNRRQNDFILENVINDGGKYWIGLFNDSGELKWSNGKGVDFTSWKGGQPDSHRGQENCAVYDFGGGGDWEFQNCDVAANWICRRTRGAGPPTGVPPQPTSEPCSAERFVRRYAASQGQSSKCLAIDTTYGVTVDQCKTHTCLVAGNTFNYMANDQSCHAKKCIGGDLELTTDSGGADVYALDGPSCDEPGWKFYNDWCWYVSGEGTGEGDLTWFKAQEKCNQRGGQLASIRNQLENAVLTNIVSRTGHRMVWIGLNRLDLGGWKWTDGSPDDFINWAKGEPNDHHYGQLCTNFYGYSGFWNDDNCADPNGYVCKKRKGSVSPIPPTASTLVPGFCPQGYIGTGNKCYKVFGKDNRDDWKKWEDSVEACRAFGPGYDLASINSPMEQAIANIVVDGIDQNAWIGMSTKVSGGQKQWVDNSDITFENWAPGEPNGGVGECIEMYHGRLLGRWNDHGCRNLRAYLCQYRKQMDSVIGSTVNPFPQSCSKEGYDRYLGECYKIMNVPRNWDNAREMCKNDGGELVSIHSMQENSFVQYYVRQNQGSIWTGLNDKEVVGSFGWSNGWFVNFTWWGAGQPEVDDNKRCVAIEDDGKWRVTSCSESYQSLCKLLTHPAPSTPPMVPGNCPSTGNWSPYHRDCYLTETVITDTFAKAELECGNMGGTLASVHDVLENYFIRGKLIDEGVNHDIWLGMIRPYGATDGWRWTDGSPVEFFYWAPGEPSDSTGTTENCVEMWQDSGMWNDVSCDAVNKWVCKTGKNLNSSPGTTVPTWRPGQSTSPRSMVPTPGQTTPFRPPIGGSTTIPATGTRPPRSTERQPNIPGEQMSNGAKAGVAIGVIGVVLIVLLVLLVFAKRRDRVPTGITTAVNDTAGGFVNKLYFSSESSGVSDMQPASEYQSNA